MSLTRSIFQQRHLKLFVLVISISLGTTCIPAPPGPPTFQSGIRIETTEALIQAPLAQVPVGGVGHGGDLFQTLGSGFGTRTSFSGVTGANGISDWSDSRTNATWDFTVSYLTTIPACGTARRNGVFVPTTGLWWRWTCYL